MVLRFVYAWSYYEDEDYWEVATTPVWLWEADHVLSDGDEPEEEDFLFDWFNDLGVENLGESVWGLEPGQDRTPVVEALRAAPEFVYSAEFEKYLRDLEGAPEDTVLFGA